MDRRTFLKLMGGAAATVAAAPLLPASAAPLFIPSDRLDFVPHAPKFYVPEPSEILAFADMPAGLGDYGLPGSRMVMTLHDNYMPNRSGRIKSGSLLLATNAEADRWIAHGIAVPVDPGLNIPMRDDILPGRDWGKHGATFIHEDRVTSTEPITYTVQSQEPEKYIDAFFEEVKPKEAEQAEKRIDAFYRMLGGTRPKPQAIWMPKSAQGSPRP